MVDVSLEFGDGNISLATEIFHIFQPLRRLLSQMVLLISQREKIRSITRTISTKLYINLNFDGYRKNKWKIS
jgi:hypothetical protein